MTLGLRFMPDLAEWVEGALRKSGLSQKELAERLSEKVGRPIYQTMISKMIRGARKPDFDEVLGISIITSQPLPLRHIGSRVIPVSGAIRDGGHCVGLQVARGLRRGPSRRNDKRSCV